MICHHMKEVSSYRGSFPAEGKKTHEESNVQGASVVNVLADL